MKKYDAIVVGSGQAGTPLIFKLASEGKSVAFIEKHKIGGTCLNTGCTPTKAYVASARRMWDAQHGEELGVEIPAGAKANLVKIKARKDSLIKKSVDGIQKSIDGEDKITFYEGEAKFTGQKQVIVNGEEMTADLVFINVGGRPNIPEGYDDVPYLTNESILNLTELPAHLLIVGGSYIGLEFGQMFRRYGSKVTIVEKGSRIIGREDQEVSKAIQDFLETEGIEFMLNAECIKGAKDHDGAITIDLDCKEKGNNSVRGSHLLLAVGRRPNTDTLNLEATGVKTNKRGYIVVDDHCETSVKGIFALGDCNGEGAFTHTAYNDFQVVADFLFGDQNRKISNRIVTYGLFVDPPLGRAGLTKQQAIDQGYKIKEAKRAMSRIARAKEKGETNGFMSIIIDQKTDRVLGAAVLGVGGDEVISGILNVMYANQPYTLIRDSVQIHPTISELIPTMLEKPKEVD